MLQGIAGDGDEKEKYRRMMWFKCSNCKGFSDRGDEKCGEGLGAKTLTEIFQIFENLPSP